MSDPRLERSLGERSYARIASEFGGNLWLADGKSSAPKEKTATVVSPERDVPRQFAGMVSAMHEAGFVVVKKPAKTIIVPSSDAHPEIADDFAQKLTLDEQRALFRDPRDFYQKKITERASKDPNKPLAPPDLRVQEDAVRQELTPSDVVRLIHAPARFLLFYFQRKHEIKGNIKEISWDVVRPVKQKKTLHSIYNEELEIYERSPCLMERIWADVHELISQQIVFSNEDAVQSLLIGYTEILSFFREKWYKKGLEEKTSVGYRYPEIRGLHEQIINLLRLRENSRETRNFLYGILMYSELSDDQCEETMEIMDGFGDLHRPLALQLSAQLAASRGENSAWIQLQESRRNELIAEMSGLEQELYDKYQDLAEKTKGLVIAESWLAIKPRKVGLEIEYGDQAQKADCPGFVAGIDLGDTLELRKSRNDLLFRVEYITQLANLEMYFDTASPEGIHIHLDVLTHPTRPVLPGIDVRHNDQTPDGKIDGKVFTWEVRGITIPRIDDFQRLDPVSISNLITLYYHLSQENREEIILEHSDDRLLWQQLIFGYLVCKTSSPEGRLASLMVLDNPVSLSAINLIDISQSYSNVGIDELVESISNSFPDTKLFEARVVRNNLALLLDRQIRENPHRITGDKKMKYLWIIESFGGEISGLELARLYTANSLGDEVLPIIAKIGGEEAVIELISHLSKCANQIELLEVVDQIGGVRAVKKLLSIFFFDPIYSDDVQRSILDIISRKINSDESIREKLIEKGTSSLDPSLYYLLRFAQAYTSYKITGAQRPLALKILEKVSNPSASLALVYYLTSPTVEQEEIPILLKSITEFGDDDSAYELVKGLSDGEHKNIETEDVFAIARKNGGDRTALALVNLVSERTAESLKQKNINEDEVMDLAFEIGGEDFVYFAVDNLISNKPAYQSRRKKILRLARERGGPETGGLLVTNIEAFLANTEEVAQIVEIAISIGDDETAELLIDHFVDKENFGEILIVLEPIIGDRSSLVLLLFVRDKKIKPENLEWVMQVIEKHAEENTLRECLTMITDNSNDDEDSIEHKLRLWKIFKSFITQNFVSSLAESFVSGKLSAIPINELFEYFISNQTHEALATLAQGLDSSIFPNEHLADVISLLLSYGYPEIEYIILTKVDKIPIDEKFALRIYYHYIGTEKDFVVFRNLAALFSQGLLTKIPIAAYLELLGIKPQNSKSGVAECFARLISGIRNKIFSENETVMIINKIIELRLQSHPIVSSALLGSIHERSFSDHEFERVIAFISLLPPIIIDELPLTFYRATQLTPAQKKLLLLQIENRGGENTFVQLIYSYLALVQTQEINGYSGSITDLALALDVIERRGEWSAMMALESIYLHGKEISDEERMMIRNSYRSMLMRGVGDKKPTGGLMKKAK